MKLPARAGRRRPRLGALGYSVLVLTAGLAFLGSLCLGSVPLSPLEVLKALGAKLFGLANVDPISVAIVWQLRLARSLLAAVAGAALGASGAVLQGLFRNPLADPYSMGVSAGASLGAVIAIVAGISTGASFIGAVEISSFIGALGASFLVYMAARVSRRISPTAALLLAGAAVGSFVSAVVALIVTFNDKDLHSVFYWMLGGFGGKSWNDVATAAPAAALSLAGALFLARPLDVLAAGEETAGTLGLDVALLRRLAVITASLGAAAAVAAGGVVGFVGLLGPHFARLIVGPLHRRLIPLAAAVGAVLLMTADALARSVAAPLELPVGIVTAFIGAPVFLHLLSRTGQRTSI
ncbi:MAG: iron ABC transporter permease [Spirochaetia bacterium]|nr:iron ABC transporter permease [Spirochaetales bacterium]MDX9784130.1 iron ABC transporter permease [Spirochaetia bacterium]